jgi:hypothetical protein
VAFDAPVREGENMAGKVVIYARVPVALRERILDRANAEERTPSDVIRRVLANEFMPKVECPECGGTGRVGTSSDEPGFCESECPRCRGKCKIAEEV